MNDARNGTLNKYQAPDHIGALLVQKFRKRLPWVGGNREISAGNILYANK